MTDETTPAPWRSLALLMALAALAGVGVGILGGAFRWSIEQVNAARVALFGVAAEHPEWGWLLAIAFTAAGATIAALLVKWVPAAAGSGIQYVEAVERGQRPPSAIWVMVAKFVGGVFSIGSGLVLGREGPTVHIGAVLGAETARRAKRPLEDVRTLHSALSGAGLAVAFNSPVGGSLFVVEEVARSVKPRIVLPTLAGVAVATATAWLIVGNKPIFEVSSVPAPDLLLVGLFAVFGLLTGALGALYNRMILASLTLARRARRVPPVAQAAIIGGVVGALLYVDPLGAGGGDPISQGLLSGQALVPLVLVTTLVIRFLAGPISYAAGTPGGLFAPLLAIGALWGALCASIMKLVIPDVPGATLVVFVLVGMSSMFAATIRAPLTGIVVVVEMTAVATVLAPMLAASVCAIVVAAALRTRPIYEDLRERMLHPPAVQPWTFGLDTFSRGERG
ncbi:ClC family H(+)/Cl(-) exchange transporter [Microbacterium sediminicola]|uniref:ClC family H(+)/Cl(-) exchange transporter n=1 Tax=Microbacterium sediminicola TaxID=415210 RepID=A0ABP4UAC7_9MICO